MRKSLTICFLLLVTVCFLWGCESGSPVLPVTEATTEAPAVEEIAMVVTADTIGELDSYPDLKKADLTGSTCYKMIQRYIRNHPDVEVIYTVDLGGTQVQPDAVLLQLEDGKFDYAMTTENLQYLPDLEEVYFPDLHLTLEEYVQLRNAYSKVKMNYSVMLGNTKCESDVQALDLSGLTTEEVAEAAQRLGLLPGLAQAELMNEEGVSNLSLEDVAALQAAAPGVVFHYSFLLFDQEISTTDEEVIFANRYIGNQIEGAADQLRQALKVMKGCKRFVLDNCHFENEVMAEIREEFRDTTKLVWRVWFGTDGSCLTDREVIRYMPTLTGDNSANLIYCEDARFIDVGHNEALFNVDFVAKMSKLEAIIISGSPVKDMSAFAGCESLEFLELAYCAYVEDISAVAQCGNLKRINLAYTAVSDLSPLDGLDLTVMVDNYSRVPEEERTRFEELHPDCLVLHTSDQPYGYPWRYTEKGVWNDYYAMLREIFDYDHPAQTRW